MMEYDDEMNELLRKYDTFDDGDIEISSVSLSEDEDIFSSFAVAMDVDKLGKTKKKRKVEGKKERKKGKRKSSGSRFSISALVKEDLSPADGYSMSDSYDDVVPELSLVDENNQETFLGARLVEDIFNETVYINKIYLGYFVNWKGSKNVREATEFNYPRPGVPGFNPTADLLHQYESVVLGVGDNSVFNYPQSAYSYFLRKSISENDPVELKKIYNSLFLKAESIYLPDFNHFANFKSILSDHFGANLTDVEYGNTKKRYMSKEHLGSFPFHSLSFILRYMNICALHTQFADNREELIEFTYILLRILVDPLMGEVLVTVQEVLGSIFEHNNDDNFLSKLCQYISKKIPFGKYHRVYNDIITFCPIQTANIHSNFAINILNNHFNCDKDNASILEIVDQILELGKSKDLEQAETLEELELFSSCLSLVDMAITLPYHFGDEYKFFLETLRKKFRLKSDQLIETGVQEIVTEVLFS